MEVLESVQKVKLRGNMAHWVAACLFFLVALQWLSVALASHFRYGTISWAPINYYSNTVNKVLNSFM